MTDCKGCGKPIVPGQFRRGDDHHLECHPLCGVETRPARGRRKRTPPELRDIKAPDGYTLGGLRLVRKDGTILFGRGWWQAPVEWAGQKVWVHEEWAGNELYLEAAEPGIHIYSARMMKPPRTVACERTERADAKPVFRTAANRAWLTRSAA